MIRDAEERDLPRLREMGASFHAFAGFAGRGLSYDPGSLDAFCRGLMASPDAFFVVSETAGEVVGTMAGALVPWFLDHSQRVAMETWWWVDPQARGGRAAAELLRAFELWGAERGARVILMAALSGCRDGALSRLYRRRGYGVGETYYFREV